jgi:hypothetical protein
VCPVCAAKISERRKAEIDRVVSFVPSLGIVPVLVTYTLRHQYGEALKDCLGDLIEAYKLATSGRIWEAIKTRHTIVGSVRTFEMTHGINGWHPHIHALLFVDADLDKLSADLQERWMGILPTVGRTGIDVMACDVRISNDAVADYISKWGREPVDRDATIERYWSMQREVAKSTSKKANKGGRNPFQILMDTGLQEDKQSRYLFREYISSTKGRRQLEWSRVPDLRSMSGIAAATDEEVMNTHDQEAYMLARLTFEQWQIVLRNAAVGTLLNIASDGNVSELYEFLYDIGAGNVTTGVDLT